MKNNGWSSLLILALVGVLAYAFYKWVSNLHFGDGSGGSGRLPGGHGSGDGDNDGSSAAKAALNLTHETGDGKKPVFIAPKKPTPAQIAAREKLAKLSQAKYTTDWLKPLLPKFWGTTVIHAMGNKKLPYTPEIQAIAKRVSAANKDAEKFRGTYGTTPAINQSLDELHRLNDVDFGKVITTWKQIDGFSDPIETDLCSANIDNAQRSDFLTRLFKLGFAVVK